MFKSRLFLSTGFLLLGLGLILGLWIYLPLAAQEIKYDLKPVPVVSKEKEVTPPDPDFSIYIPKIDALAPVVPDVDPYDSNIYQRSLTNGVAQAKGSAYPGTPGRVFMFAHSAGNPLAASRYNAVFYLISKLVKGDKIFVWYKNVRYSYQVTDKKTVDASAVSYLSKNSDKPSLVLMTCWPAGTTLKRLLVFAEPE